MITQRMSVAGKHVWPPRLLVGQLLHLALAVGAPAVVAAVRGSALRGWLQLALGTQLEVTSKLCCTCCPSAVDMFAQGCSQNSLTVEQSPMACFDPCASDTVDLQMQRPQTVYFFNGNKSLSFIVAGGSPPEGRPQGHCADGCWPPARHSTCEHLQQDAQHCKHWRDMSMLACARPVWSQHHSPCCIEHHLWLMIREQLCTCSVASARAVLEAYN